MAPKWRKGISQETYNAIREQYSAGVPAADISAKLGVPAAAVFRYVKDILHVPRHGLSKHPLYRVWGGMCTRCNNPNASSYKWYGGRGIKVCKEWAEDFTAFYRWAITNGYTMPEPGKRNKLSLARINPDEGYSPANCRWTTQHVQVAGQRKNTRNTTGYKGIYPDHRYGGFIAEVTIHGKTVRLGKFKSTKEAAAARDKFIKQNHLSEYSLQLPHKEV